jgi:hypothetical protein
VRYLDRGGIRHVAMRAGLGFVLGWFGIQELRNPSDWAVFVPSFVADHSPVALNDLIILHGYLLIVSAAAVLLGLLYIGGCLLAMGLLSEVVLGLWLDGGVSDLVIRDIGLLALAGGLAIDPVRSWRVDNVLPRLASPSQPGKRSARTARGALPARAEWPTQAAAGVLVVAAALGLAVLLRANGSSGPALAGQSAISPPSSAASPSPEQTPPAPSGVTPTPAPSAGTPSSVRFDDWPYKQYAFQIYPGDISSQTERALAGFQLSVQDQGDKVRVTLKALSSRYRDAEVVIDKVDTAYFIETSMGDDPSNVENNLSDDGIIVVNPQGYILQS